MFDILRYLYSTIADRVSENDFVKNLQESHKYRIGGGYRIPVIDIDGMVYYDPTSNVIKQYDSLTDVVILLQDTNEIGGW